MIRRGKLNAVALFIEDHVPGGYRYVNIDTLLFDNLAPMTGSPHSTKCECILSPVFPSLMPRSLPSQGSGTKGKFPTDVYHTKIQ